MSHKIIKISSNSDDILFLCRWTKFPAIKKHISIDTVAGPIDSRADFSLKSLGENF